MFVHFEYVMIPENELQQLISAVQIQIDAVECRPTY